MWRWMVAGLLAVGMLSAEAAEPQGDAVLGGRLLYSRLTNGTWQIWQTDLNTGQATQMTTSAGDKRYPAWLASGRIAYHTSNHGSFVLDRGGKAAPFLERLWPVRDLVWSPDGAQAVFSRFRTDIIDHANLWVTDAAGSEPRLLTQEAGIQYNPSWSPDGLRLVYTAGHGYGTYELWTVRLDGTELRRLTKNRTHEFLPAWSPDGSRIAFISDATGDFEIWIMQADGTNPVQLTHAPGLDSRPAWSPDGTQLAFATNRTGTMQIWVTRTDGREARPLITVAEGVTDPAWQ